MASPRDTTSGGSFEGVLRAIARTPDETSPLQTSAAPGDLVGRFEVVRLVGRGGYGVVYQALDTELGRHVP
jgi:hypothetical protein